MNKQSKKTDILEFIINVNVFLKDLKKRSCSIF
jgi:hypothetical protein